MSGAADLPSVSRFIQTLYLLRQIETSVSVVAVKIRDCGNGYRLSLINS